MRYQIITSIGTRYAIYDHCEESLFYIVRYSREAAQAWVGVKNIVERLRQANPHDPDLDRAEEVLMAELRGETNARKG